MQPFRFRSFRTKLQAAFLTLGLAAIGITGWEASAGATEALQQATFDRLNAIRETRSRQLERYFEDLRKHVVALSTDEATITALESFQQAWDGLTLTENVARIRALREFYDAEYRARASREPEQPFSVEHWFPQDARTRALQYWYLAANPHAQGSRDLLLEAEGAGRYGQVHSRYHPTFHRYQSAFGFYDILLISNRDGRVLYSVLKEIDLGSMLEQEPFASTTLARAYRSAKTLREEQDPVLEDYAPYAASYFAPAAFGAAPVRRAGAPVGVLAIQVSIQEVNRVMTGESMWAKEGLGETGQAYVVGPDTLLRSDVRVAIESPQRFLRELEGSGASPVVIEKVRNNHTAVLTLPVSPEVAVEVQAGGAETSEGHNVRGVPVLRSHGPLKVGGLKWTVVAEIESREALAPVAALQRRILTIGLIISAAFFAAAGWLAASVTRPVLALARNVRQLGSTTLGMQAPVESFDEVGQLTEAFNRMSEDLRKTTVSKAELEVLAGRLISAQEEERSRVARELHDDLTQRLAAVAIEAGRLAKLPESMADQQRAGLERVKQEMARIADDVHGLSRRLHPAMLDDLGLVAAVEGECRGFLERGGPFVDFAAEGDWSQVTRDTQLAMYRIVQEGLRNIQRHSAATEVTLRLAANGAASLEIRDNGEGFDRTSPDWRPGIGLASMEERTRLLGGTFAVKSHPGKGTVIRAEFPVVEKHG